jgi:hypothetical protein
MNDNNSPEQKIQSPIAKVSATELIDQLCLENHSLRQENNDLKRMVCELKSNIDVLINTVAAQKEVIQELKDEIARLNGRSPKPKIPPNRLEGNKSPRLHQRTKLLRNDRIQKNGLLLWATSWESRAISMCGRLVVAIQIHTTRPLEISAFARKVVKATKRKSSKPGQPKGKPRKKKTELTIHERIVVEVANVPEGALLKGYKRYLVQDIDFKAHTTQYLLARWQLPDGSYVSGQLPEEIDGHYGSELRAYVINQFTSCRVTEELILEELHDRGVLISAGQLSNILIQNKECFHEEVDELLAAGVEAEKQIQVDDTGGRHQGTNQYTTIIGNKWFSLYTTTASKSRVNFLKLLQKGKEEYLINEDTLEFLRQMNKDCYLPGYLAFYVESKFSGLADWKRFLQERNITKESEVRHVTEAALYASVIANGVPRDLGVHSDDAGQFDVFVHSLCWIHEERHYRKLIMADTQAQADLELVRDRIWAVYNSLKKFVDAPSEEAKQAIKTQFEDTFKQVTSSPTLNHQMEKTYKKRDELLRVLQRPNTPLHNNASETGARAAKIKLKISGGTRSDLGRQARDTFLSLKQTCRKLGINFYSFLQDRVRGLYVIPRLAEVIRQRSSGGAVGPPLESFA